jgi:F0F1-type ATP synthase assembly protein I
MARKNKLLVLRYASVQLACALIAATFFVLRAKIATDVAVVVGGFIAAFGSVVFGWRFFASDWPPSKIARGFYLGEVLKWIWMIGAITIALKFGSFIPMGLILGVAVGQIGFLIGVGFLK